MEKVKVVLTKSLIGAKPNQKATAKSLGLNKIGDSIVHDNDAVLGGKVKVCPTLLRLRRFKFRGTESYTKNQTKEDHHETS